MVPDQQRLTSEERVNLVAFLDDELNDAEKRAISTKLTQSLTARRELEALQKTWELLDYLPRPQASVDFTARTLVGVQEHQEKGDKIVQAVSSTLRKVVATLILVVGSTLLFALGHILVAWVWPNPSARLARELSIAERLDEYRDVERFEFLDLLDKSPEFNSDGP